MDTFGDFSIDGTEHGVGANNEHDTLRTSFNSNGKFMIQTPNMNGGHDTFLDGKHVTHTENNNLGGQNIYHGTHLAQMTIPNAEGGVDIYGDSMNLEGHMIPDGAGGEDYLSSTGNSETIIDYQNPLAHVGELRMPPFNVKSYK